MRVVDAEKMDTRLEVLRAELESLKMRQNGLIDELQQVTIEIAQVERNLYGEQQYCRLSTLECPQDGE